MSTKLDLSRLLQSTRDDAQTVAFDTDYHLNWRDFCHAVQQRYNFFEASKHQNWAIYFDHSAEFAATLLALWHADKCAYIVGDNLAATVTSVTEQVDAFVGDFTLAHKSHVNTADIKQLNAATLLPIPAIQDTEKLCAVIYTSGTTGSPVKVPLCLRQLSAELDILESLFTPVAVNFAVISTVSHQHFYGLLFRLLWPLAAGRPFAAYNCRYLEQLQASAGEYKTVGLVTTPSHLSRLPITMDWQVIKTKIAAVFSSTAPLNLADSQASQTKFGLPIYEIFGSSETGGIAWRQQTLDPNWQAFPGIEIESDPCSKALKLRSQHSFKQDWQQTADKIQLNDQGRFKLLGRLDRIAKIEGKRVSLTAMEASLQQHDYIEQAKTLVLEREKNTIKRVEVAVVAQINKAGLDFISQNGKRALNQLLRKKLQQQFELPVLPRRWRYMQQLPTNAQGKTSHQALINLFDTRPGKETV